MAKKKGKIPIGFRTPKSKIIKIRNKKTGKIIKLRNRNFRKSPLLPEEISSIARKRKRKRKRDSKGRFV